jgi:hypothetical protein
MIYLALEALKIICHSDVTGTGASAGDIARAYMASAAAIVTASLTELRAVDGPTPKSAGLASSLRHGECRHSEAAFSLHGMHEARVAD